MKTVIWLAEGTWQACVDAARALPEGDPPVLLHVVDPDAEDAVHAARAGLFGRGRSDADGTLAGAAARAEEAIFAAARARLGRPCVQLARRGRPEREVVAACAGADLLVAARDGDHSRLGPRSLGHATRFVLDHAPCAVLLVWPDAPPDLATLPPPPHHR
jgi:nucleotide-binding universal stress UspA family protein